MQGKRWGVFANIAVAMLGSEAADAQSFRDAWPVPPAAIPAATMPAGIPGDACIEGGLDSLDEELQRVRANQAAVCAGAQPDLRIANVPPEQRENPPQGDTFADGLGDLDLAGRFGFTDSGYTTIAETVTSNVNGSQTDTFQQRVHTPLEDTAPTTAERSLGPTANLVAGGPWLEATPESGKPAMFSSYHRSEGGLVYNVGTAETTDPKRRNLVLSSAGRELTSRGLVGMFTLDDLRPLPTDPDAPLNGAFTARRIPRDEADVNGGALDATDSGPLASSNKPFVARVLTYGSIVAQSAAIGGSPLPRRLDNFIVVDLLAALNLDQDFDDPDKQNQARIDEFVAGAPKDLVFDSGGEDQRNVRVDLNPEDGVLDNDALPMRRVVKPHPEDLTRVLFAAGDLDGVLGLPDQATGLVAARFLVTPGVTDAIDGDATSLTLPDPDGLSATRSTRAFLRRETCDDLGGTSLSEITDRGLSLVNPSRPLVALSAARGAAPGSVVPGGADGVVLHADFGLADAAGGRISSISATIGSVDYRLSVENDSTAAPPHLAVDAILSARTVASSNAGDGEGSILVTSGLLSTAAGGGNPRIGAPGRLGFFVAQNAGDVFDDVATPNPRSLPGGVEQPLGDKPDAPDRRYGLIRLATASESFVPDRRRGFGAGLEGYAAGWVELEAGDAIALAPVARAGDGPNLSFGAPDLDLNHLTGTLTIGDRTLGFGGPGGRSAYVDDLTYGLLSDGGGSAMAIISAEPVGRELSGRFRTSDGQVVPVPIRDAKNRARHPQDREYRYVQWGFFFGDAVTREGRREHVHLGTYAAGAPIDRAQLAQARGSATYTGHAVGNVYNGGRVYSSLGTVRERFDFDRRAGTTTLDFDRRKYSGKSRLSGEAYGSAVASGDRIGRLNGRFVGGMSGKPSQPNALVGGFEIQNRSTGAGAYRATGTFGAERR